MYSSSSSPAFYSSPSSHMMSSMFSSPSYSMSVQSYSESPLELTSSSSKSRRKPANPQRVCQFTESISPKSQTKSPITTNSPSIGPSDTDVSKELQVSESENKPPAKKKKASPVPDELKDADYWVRRKKNNESARRSREAKKAQAQWVEKRIVELKELLIRAETENKFLNEEIARLTNEMKNKTIKNGTRWP